MVQFLNSLFPSHSRARISAGRRARWASLFVLVLLLVQSAFWSSNVPWPLKILVGAVAVLAAIRPGDALVVVAGLAPLSQLVVTSVWHAYPFALSEALVLAFFAGYLWCRRREMFRKQTDEFALTTSLFALVVLASCAVQLVVLQVWHDYPARYAADFVKYLATGYLTLLPDPRAWVDGRGFSSIAAVLLEGVALLRCTRLLCAEQPDLARRLTTAIVAAGAGAALLSFYEPLATALGSNRALGTVFGSIRSSSPAIPSLDTAGVYFMFVVFVAVGVAAASRAGLLPGLFSTGACLGAMWLTRTRAAVVAGLAVVVAGVFWRASARFRWSFIRAALVSALAAFVVATGVVVYNPFHVLASGGNLALHLRVLMAETGLRMMAAAPVLGVGVGQYESRYHDFASPELLTYYAVNNAHNYLLWMGAELGLMGLGLFVWLVATALRKAWSQVHKGQTRYELVGVFAGLSAFVITWLIGQPMAVPPVAYTFWIALGLIAASPNAPRAAADVRQRPPLATIALVAFIVGVVASVPVRARRAIADIDLSRVSYGFYNPGEAEDHRPFRWAGPHVRFFMRSSVRAIEVPLAAKLPATIHGVEVDILVNQRLADRIVLADREWHLVKLNTPVAPESPERFWRIDLNLTPIGLPAGTPEEERRIAVGKISTIPR